MIFLIETINVFKIKSLTLYDSDIKIKLIIKLNINSLIQKIFPK